MRNPKDNYFKIQAEISNRAKLIAVSKTQSTESILELYQLGQRDFGENYVQEWRAKAEALKTAAPEIRWHFIGRLQSNKIKYLIGKTFLIHSVDRRSLLEEIEKQSAKKNRITSVLIEMDLAGEENKGGLKPEGLDAFLVQANHYSHVQIKGLMLIPPAADEAEASRKYFKRLKSLSIEMNEKKIYKHPLIELSMGMSGDYEIAMEEGATMVRVGTKLFGERSNK
ncbi:MAG: YggS family pyridoxal phosphate-dependent enzyme [Deltaproteobacteria bacterium]|nr:YggS family pyridoxal phosphate-dependent enzyme [Deltaproteobacteria bacterium]